MDEPIEYEGYTIKIHQDFDVPNPRIDGEYFSLMTTWHRRHVIGDFSYTGEPGTYSTAYVMGGHRHNRITMYTPYPQDFEADLVRDKCVYLPLYLLDHSGLFLSTESFHDSWDSGQIGWIWASLKSIREEYGWKNVTQKRRKAVLGRLQAEVNEYNQWLTGDVYCFEIFDAAGDGVDGMCGWYGYDNCLEAAYEAVAEIIAGKEEDAETWATIQEELHVVL